MNHYAYILNKTKYKRVKGERSTIPKELKRKYICKNRDGNKKGYDIRNRKSLEWKWNIFNNYISKQFSINSVFHLWHVSLLHFYIPYAKNIKICFRYSNWRCRNPGKWSTSKKFRKRYMDQKWPRGKTICSNNNSW